MTDMPALCRRAGRVTPALCGPPHVSTSVGREAIKAVTVRRAETAGDAMNTPRSPKNNTRRPLILRPGAAQSGGPRFLTRTRPTVSIVRRPTWKTNSGNPELSAERRNANDLVGCVDWARLERARSRRVRGDRLSPGEARLDRPGPVHPRRPLIITILRPTGPADWCCSW